MTEVKVCRYCGEEKPYSELRSKKRRDGSTFYTTLCKPCANAAAVANRRGEKLTPVVPNMLKQFNDKRREELRAAEDAAKSKVCRECGVDTPLAGLRRARRDDGSWWYEPLCKSCASNLCVSWRKENPEKAATSVVNWRVRNPDKVRESDKRFRENHPDRRAATRVAWAKRNPDKIRAIQSRWNEKNPGKVTAKDAKRRASELNATPTWADMERIQQFYEDAKFWSQYGEELHVDHIIPLQGKTVCGLHVHNNLQLLPASVNLSKGNRLQHGDY